MTDQPGREKALRIATDYTTAAEAASGERQALADEILALVREEREAAAIAVDQWPIVRNLEAKLAASEQAREKAERDAEGFRLAAEAAGEQVSEDQWLLDAARARIAALESALADVLGPEDECYGQREAEAWRLLSAQPEETKR